MTERRRAGRPMKYPHFIMTLEDDVVYTPGTVALLGQELGFLDDVPDSEKSDARMRVRHTLARYRVNHKFPIDGDGMVRVRGQAPTIGWKGGRWKEPVAEHEQEKGRAEAERLKRKDDDESP